MSAAAGRSPDTDVLPWGESPYDQRTPAEVVHDYAVVRGDLSEQYAREQLALWIERYAAHRATDTVAAILGNIAHEDWCCAMGCTHMHGPECPGCTCLRSTFQRAAEQVTRPEAER